MVKFCVIDCKSAEGLKMAEATPGLVWDWQVRGPALCHTIGLETGALDVSYRIVLVAIKGSQHATIIELVPL